MTNYITGKSIIVTGVASGFGSLVSKKASSLGGICGMTLTIARDLANEGVQINTILPGIFETPPLARISDKIRDSLNASVPFPKRMGKPYEYADLAETLIRNTYFNGQTIRLDGAIRMAPR